MMRRLVWISCLSLLCGALAACGPTTHTVEDAGPGNDAGPPAVIPEVGQSASGLVSADEGGEVSLGSVLLHVPAGGVRADTEITVTAVDETVAAPFTAFTPVFQFEPAGTRFDLPATVRIPFNGDAEIATIFWTTDDGQTYAALDTRVEGGYAIAEVEHFSRAFVGTACTGSSCCGRANGELDVLMMVDNSNSMTEEQASLSAQIPHMARVLATGDLDGDGVQDFPALRSVRIGTVGSDMGTGGFTVPTCARSDFGDDGVLQTEGDAAQPACLASYPSYAELGTSTPGTTVDDFVQQVQCTATLGVGGCGFEQPLEAVLKALTPSTSALTFHAGSSGHADGANAGFLRPDSILATILMTDENDCSASDPGIFDPASGTYTADLNLRCTHYDTALHPIQRYVDGLRATRSDPNDLVLGIVAGIPIDLAGQPPSVINADPRMVETVDPTVPTRLTPSCNVAGIGMAFPPRRLVDLADQLGGASTVQSICQSDFTPVVDAILTQVASRASGTCAP